MSTATLNGYTATHARVQIPAWGIWYADATIDGEVSLAGAVTLTIADLVLRGTVLSGGAQLGRSSFRIVGGAGGWGRTVPAKSWNNDAGVKVSTVLDDAAAAAGETLDAATVSADRVGPAWARAEGPAGAELERLAPSAWYMGEDGVTRLGRRAATDYAGTAQHSPPDLARGTVTLAETSIAALLPGVRVAGLDAVDVLHEVSPTTPLRSTLWGAMGTAGTSRRLAALRRIFDQLDPDRRFRGVSEYRVVTQDGERLNLQPIRVSLGMPDLGRVVVRPGVAGCRAAVALGSSVLVAFVNAAPARPVVVGFEDAEGGGFVPTRLDLVGVDDTVSAASATGRVVRYGDTVMMPLGAAGTPTATPLVANPVGTSSLSRVRA